MRAKRPTRKAEAAAHAAGPRMAAAASVAALLAALTLGTSAGARTAPAELAAPDTTTPAGTDTSGFAAPDTSGFAAPDTSAFAAPDTGAFAPPDTGAAVFDTTGFGSPTAPAEFDTSWTSDSLLFMNLPEEAESTLHRASGAFYLPDLTVNRVDGWTPGVRFGCRPSEGWFPRFEMRAAWALDRTPRGLYSLEIAQPVLPGRRLYLGGQARRATDSEDDDRVGGVENALSTFLFRYDYRDYFVREGVSVFADSRPLSWLAASVTYADHFYRSLPDSTPDVGSVFRRNSPWRANPGIDDGRMRSVLVTVELDRRDEPSAPRRGAWLRLESEASGPGLSSDFTFTRYEAEARGYLPLTLGMDIKGRVLAGTTGAGTLPFQKEFAVGGISTLRAHNYKFRRGDHVFLANGEYGVLLWRGRQRSGIRANVRFLVFLDVGQAWKGKSYDLARQRMLVDGGFGLGLADGRVRVYAAHDLSHSGSRFLWTVRLSRPF